MYNMLKKLIKNNRFEEEDMKRKLDLYLLTNRISEDEYTELYSMIKSK